MGRPLRRRGQSAGRPEMPRKCVADTCSSLRAVCRVEPHRYAPVHESIAVVPGRIDLGVVCPLERSRFGIDRDHLIEAGGKNQKAIDEDWCSFESASLFSVFPVGNITGMKDPGDFEPRHVPRIELGQPRIAHPAGVTSVVWPIHVGRRLC
jgi:hypothetical protein